MQQPNINEIKVTDLKIEPFFNIKEHGFEIVTILKYWDKIAFGSFQSQKRIKEIKSIIFVGNGNESTEIVHLPMQI